MMIPKDTTVFSRCPGGPHGAICQRLIDLGTQEETFGGKSKRLRKVRIEFAVTGQLDDQGDPYIVGEEYTMSMNEKANLRKMLECWRGSKFSDAELDAFNLDCVLGKPALLQVSIRDSGWPKIDSVGRLPKEMTVAPLDGYLLSFSMNPTEFRSELFEKLPEWLQRKVLLSPEYMSLAGEETKDADDSYEDDIPF